MGADYNLLTWRGVASPPPSSENLIIPTANHTDAAEIIQDGFSLLVVAALSRGLSSHRNNLPIKLHTFLISFILSKPLFTQGGPMRAVNSDKATAI